MAKWTGSKPGGPQQEHLIPLTERSPEEARAIRSKGGKAAQKKRREQQRLSQVIRGVLAMGYESGKVADPDSIYTLADAESQNVPIQTLIVMREVRKYLEQGDTESRNWLFEHGFPVSEEGLPPDDAPLGSGGRGGTGDNSATEGVRIHLIRGEKPPQEVNEEDAATRAAAALATVEAMKAVEAAIEEERRQRESEVNADA